MHTTPATLSTYDKAQNYSCCGYKSAAPALPTAKSTQFSSCQLTTVPRPLRRRLRLAYCAPIATHLSSAAAVLCWLLVRCRLHLAAGRQRKVRAYGGVKVKEERRDLGQCVDSSYRKTLFRNTVKAGFIRHRTSVVPRESVSHSGQWFLNPPPPSVI